MMKISQMSKTILYIVFNGMHYEISLPKRKMCKENAMRTNIQWKMWNHSTF